jgi:hypothetical protein
VAKNHIFSERVPRMVRKWSVYCRRWNESEQHNYNLATTKASSLSPSTKNRIMWEMTKWHDRRFSFCGSLSSCLGHLLHIGHEIGMLLNFSFGSRLISEIAEPKPTLQIRRQNSSGKKSYSSGEGSVRKTTMWVEKIRKLDVKMYFLTNWWGTLEGGGFDPPPSP